MKIYATDAKKRLALLEMLIEIEKILHMIEWHDKNILQKLRQTINKYKKELGKNKGVSGNEHRR